MDSPLTRPASVSIHDYLDAESFTEIKHEYLDGEVVAMGGSSARHGLAVTGLSLAIGPHAARRKGCQLFMADMKLRVDHAPTRPTSTTPTCCSPATRRTATPTAAAAPACS